MKKSVWKKYALPVILGAALISAFWLALRIGSTPLSAASFRGGLFGLAGYETERLILWHIRLPRALGALLAGAGLSGSGCLLQSVTRNDLAGPNIIGVNAGAGFAAILALFLFPAAAAILPLPAFLGAFGATLLILGLASRGRARRSTLVLAGVAVGALLNAAISFLSLLDTDILSSYNHFSIGGLAGLQLKELIFPAVMILLSLLIALLLGRRIDCLSLGDSIAASLGIRVKALRMLCLILASASAAAAVSFAGLLGFIGLMVPHIARRLCGSAMRAQLPLSALLGSTLLLLADLLGRILIAPSELPVGILTALLGAPFFLWLLLRKEAHYED